MLQDKRKGSIADNVPETGSVTMETCKETYNPARITKKTQAHTLRLFTLKIGGNWRICDAFVEHEQRTPWRTGMLVSTGCDDYNDNHLAGSRAHSAPLCSRHARGPGLLI